ncbi:MAG TPA: NADP-dependent oxidoreductase [Candidatus Baltobacteraceae bacterium]|nr:NADP-dependent oxidoreductase [Candidatus Baltobacteraceae bacterium]
MHEPVGVEGLRYEDAPDPKPSSLDVLVKVHVCGITPTELEWPLWVDRVGHKRDYIIPANEFSGEVVALGFGTAGMAIGDEVYGLIDALRDGAAAEYIAVEARGVALKPRTIDHVHAAAIPQSGLTSWQALFDHGHLTAGQTVVIHGAAGALGNIAIQLARSVGARIVGTGRSNVESQVLDAGADVFVNLEQPGWDGRIGQADLVYDTIGGAVLERSLGIVKTGGTLVTVMAPPQKTREDIRIVHFIRDPNGLQLVEMSRMVDRGNLQPQIGAVYPLSDAKKAFAAKAGRGVAGKVILNVGL